MKKSALFLAVILLIGCTACSKPVTDETETGTTTTVSAELPKEGWITADSMRVRGGPGLIYEVIGGITGGEKVEITGKTGDWYHIKFGDTTGYVSGQYLTFTQP